jgi:hypothetical protein
MRTHILSSLKTFPMKAGRSPPFQFAVSRGQSVSVKCIEFNIRSQLTALKNVLKTFSLSSQTRVAYNNCIVQLSKILLVFTSEATEGA